MGPLKAHPQLPNPMPRAQWAGGELLALRLWQLVRWKEDGGLRLQSYSSLDVWHGPVFAADFRPEPGCSHGVYAIKYATRPRNEGEFDWLTGRDTWIWGWVALSGQVIEHEYGYRAERAVIRRLRLGVQTLLRFPHYEDALAVAWELERRYRCPVKVGYYERRKAHRLRHYLERSGYPPEGLCTAEPPPPPPPSPPAPAPRVPPSLAPQPWPPPPPAPLVLKQEPDPWISQRLPPINVRRIVRAFKRAEKELGRKWHLVGRGHVPRVSVPHRYRALLCEATGSWVRIWPRSSPRRQVLFPLALVRRAARFLRVPARYLFLREW